MTMSSSSKPIITVLGATGSQGGSVARALLRQGKFAVRATTRNVDSPKAQMLKDSGCEVVKAEYGDSESLEKAFEGAHGAWFITSFWDSGIGTVEAEVADGRRVAEAARKAGVKHLVYSTLESPATTFGDSFPTFDAKIGVEQEILYAGVPFTFVQIAWYYTNLANNIQNSHAGFYDWPRDDDGTYILRFPIGKGGLHGIFSGDVGEAFASIFADESEYKGRKVALSGELLTPESIETAFREAFPSQTFRFENPESMEAYELGLPDTPVKGALVNMYNFYTKRNPRGGDIDLTKKLNPATKSLAQYLKDCASDFKFE